MADSNKQERAQQEDLMARGLGESTADPMTSRAPHKVNQSDDQKG